MLLSYPRALQAASARLQRKQLGRQVNPIDLNRGQSCNALNAPASYQIYGIKSAGEAPEARPALLRWWDAYPSVISAPTPISSDKVADFLRDPTKTGSDYAVIDVRRNDHAVRPMFRCNLPLCFVLRVALKISRVVTFAAVTNGLPRHFMTIFPGSSRNLATQSK